MNVLQIIQRVCSLLTLPRPSGVLSSNDLQLQQLLALSNQEGESLVGIYDWQALQTEQTFTTVAAELQTHEIPSDCHKILNGTLWFRSQTQQLRGPLSPVKWQAYKGRGFSSVYPAFRIRGNQLRMTPAPTAGQTIAYEYLSKSWCSSSDGATNRTAWAADTDIPRIPDALLVLGTRWRWLQAKGFDFSAAYDEYMERRNELTSADLPAESISLNGAGGQVFVPPAPSIPDGNWNQ